MEMIFSVIPENTIIYVIIAIIFIYLRKTASPIPAKIIQKFWRRFQEKEPSNVRLAWDSLPNDNTPDDKKFLGSTSRKVKNSTSLDQFNLRKAEQVAMYRCNPSMLSFILNEEYEEYYIPYD
ncbi:hypothetical protein Glove_212g179 [Diversispora epigaea]|uniref:Uncharacterized protein n=1 Tax=Diversispora epigaea TaxID=1348612 RepID=A0A397III8_9GLOM|nr:hypothetical protein Glove_212g179 [Diversispora epigaea]